VIEHALGRPPRHPAVDDGGAADTAALDEHHRRIAENRRRACVAVQRDAARLSARCRTSR
jgi:hypothetical protein